VNRLPALSMAVPSGALGLACAGGIAARCTDRYRVSTRAARKFLQVRFNALPENDPTFHDVLLDLRTRFNDGRQQWPEAPRP
jgi:hypothetical protein